MQLSINPEVPLSPGQRLSQQILENQQLLDYPLGAGVIFSAFIISQACAQLYSFTLGPTISRSWIVTARAAQNSYFTCCLRQSQYKKAVVSHILKRRLPYYI